MHAAVAIMPAVGQRYQEWPAFCCLYSKICAGNEAACCTLPPAKPTFACPLAGNCPSCCYRYHEPFLTVQAHVQNANIYSRLKCIAHQRVFQTLIHMWCAVTSSLLDDYNWGQYRRLLDIGGCYGSFLKLQLERWPQPCGILFDLPDVGRHSHILIPKLLAAQTKVMMP